METETADTIQTVSNTCEITKRTNKKSKSIAAETVAKDPRKQHLTGLVDQLIESARDDVRQEAWDTIDRLLEPLNEFKGIERYHDFRNNAANALIRKLAQKRLDQVAVMIKSGNRSFDAQPSREIRDLASC